MRRQRHGGAEWCSHSLAAGMALVSTASSRPWKEAHRACTRWGWGKKYRQESHLLVSKPNYRINAEWRRDPKPPWHQRALSTTPLEISSPDMLTFPFYNTSSPFAYVLFSRESRHQGKLSPVVWRGDRVEVDFHCCDRGAWLGLPCSAAVVWEDEGS